MICAMCRQGLKPSSSKAAWSDDVAVRGKPAPITLSGACPVGAMRESLMKRTILIVYFPRFLEQILVLLFQDTVNSGEEIWDCRKWDVGGI